MHRHRLPPHHSPGFYTRDGFENFREEPVRSDSYIKIEQPLLPFRLVCLLICR